MALFDNLLKNDMAKGVAIGVGIVAAGVLLTPALRPIGRATVKNGILIFEKSREWFAEASESLEDLVAEVRSELAEHRFSDEELTTAAAAAMAEPVVETPAEAPAESAEPHV